MKAYNCECECGWKGDRIVKINEAVKCSKCNKVLVKVGGPIGGIGILPISDGQLDRFIAYTSLTLDREIKSESDMSKAFDEMYGKDYVPGVVAPEVEKEPEPKVKRGRPKKKVEDEEDEKDEDDNA